MQALIPVQARRLLLAAGLAAMLVPAQAQPAAQPSTQAPLRLILPVGAGSGRRSMSIEPSTLRGRVAQDTRRSGGSSPPPACATASRSVDCDV